MPSLTMGKTTRFAIRTKKRKETDRERAERETREKKARRNLKRQRRGRSKRDTKKTSKTITPPLIELGKGKHDKTFIEKVGGVLKNIDTLGGITPSAVAEREGKTLIEGILPISPAGGALGAIKGFKGGIGTSGNVGKGVITRTKTVLGGRVSFAKLGSEVTTQRAFVGKAGHQMPKMLNKIFHKTRPIAARYATNSKSMSLTNSFLGRFLTNPGTLLAAIGSYPFAGFIKEEAVQQTGFAFQSAERNEDLEGMQLAIQETEEIVNAAPSILEKIPYANVLNQLKSYFEAVEVKLNQDKRTFATINERLQNPPESFEESSKRLDEERRQTKLSQREEDAKFFKKLDEERRQLELQRRQEDQAFFENIRLQNEERQRANTLFFEALRKRNAGIRLTDEEIAALEERGVSRDLLGQRRERSTVQF